MNKITLLLVAAAATSLSPLVSSAQTPVAAASAAYDTSAFAALKWREIGPFRGGRSVAVAGSSKRQYEYYFGTTGGGVFKTTDGGVTWAPITDKYFGGTIGAIQVSESNPDIVYVGTGESPIRGNVSHGDGVFKSTDAGKTWSYAGLGDTRQIGRIRIDPKNPDVVYVAALGHVWGPNADRGVFKSENGGKSWRKVLFVSDSAGAVDLSMDPSNPKVLYAATWHAYRTPWKLVSGGSGSGIYKSTDAGETWTNISRNPGLPTGILGNIGIAVSPVNPSRVWALIEADSGAVYRSDDAGATWTKTNSERTLRQRAWYYTRIYADTKDTNTVYALNTGMYRSTDGGKTFRGIQVPHGDNHDLWIAPNDPNRMIESNDGGANVSFNAGRAWTEQDQATAQFYHVVTTNHFPYRVCGAQQDNSTLCGPSRANGGISNDMWYDVGGGESGYIAVRPDDPEIIYAGSYGGLLTRHDQRTGFERNINPWPDNPMGHDAVDAKYRFQWTFPIVISPHDPNTIYMGSSVIFRTKNEGQSWEPISPDLTRNDPRTLGPSGGPITKDQTSVEYYGTVFTIAESPITAGVIWAGSDDGLVHVTRDNGKTWRNVTPKGIPEWSRISLIEASHFSPGTAYVAANHFQMDDMRPYIYRTTDYGASWQLLVDGIPPTEFVRVVREDPVRKGLLYAGTERGVWVSFDDGAHWQTLRKNLPIVPVHDLAIKEGDLIAATHGRSFWILDDLSALRQMNPNITRSATHLFKPRDVYRAAFNGGGGTGAAGGHPTGQNPPSGAVIYYWLKTPGQLVTMDFLDSNGKLIRTFTSNQDPIVARDSVRADSVRTARADSLKKAGVKVDSTARSEARGEETPAPEDGPRRAQPPARVSNKTGLNTFVWNMRYPDASTFENIIMWAGGTNGPAAIPGAYTVRLHAAGTTESQTFKLLKDPRSKATQADLAEQFAFLMQVRDETSKANDAVKVIRNLRSQIADREKKLPADKRASFESGANTLMTQLSAVEQEIYQVKNRSGQDPLNYPIKLNNKIAALAGVASSSDARPTSQTREVFKSLSAQLDAQLAKMRSALSSSLPGLNQQLKAAGMSELVETSVETPSGRPASAQDITSDDDDGGG
ncbi:MAG TPA: glycosyl hydrolase [Gemmatimonadaceae bacterium]|nr:glycosyl hydrolase [Gemmatimonadaceae bacterium]